MIWFLKLYFCFWCSGDTLSAFLWWYIHQTLTKIRRTGESSTALQCIVRANGGIPETALKHSKQVAWLRWPRVPRANHTQANFLRIYVEQECWDGWGGAGRNINAGVCMCVHQFFGSCSGKCLRSLQKIHNRQDGRYCRGTQTRVQAKQAFFEHISRSAAAKVTDLWNNTWTYVNSPTFWFENYTKISNQHHVCTNQQYYFHYVMSTSSSSSWCPCDFWIFLVRFAFWTLSKPV